MEEREPLRKRHGGRASTLPNHLLRLGLDLVYHLATPFVLLRLLGPSRFFSRRRYRAGFRERLGGPPRRAGSGPCLWIHAVSVGELRAALPLVDGLRRSFPAWELVVSTSTDTAQDLAARSLPPGVASFYYPLDYGWAVRRTLSRVRPSVVVLLELELWPNFLLAAEEASIPVLVANGRISERSFSNYFRLRFLARPLFARVAAFAVQSEEYAARFQALGVSRERIEVLGNLKHDAPPAEDPGESTARLLGWAGDPSPVLLGGCTHAGEEEALLEVWSRLRAELPALKLVLAPRHIERAGEVEALLTSRGTPVVRWSRSREVGAASALPPPAAGRKGEVAQESPSPQGSPSAVALVVVMGELDRFYRLADVVFVGGSLVAKGGHNLLEPSRLGKAVLFGPSVENFQEIAGHLLERRAALQVEDREGLQAEVGRLLADPRARSELGERARAAAGELGGATARHLDWLRRKLAGRFSLCPGSGQG
jgi:3-deoxy-D-manno-octulosonic-acid transferase